MLDRIQELEDEYRASINQRASKLSEQQDRYSELHAAVESHTKKYKQECQRLRTALKKSEQKQAALARRLAQTLQARNDDETSHLHQLINMHDEQMLTMREGMRELLRTLGVEDTLVGNLDSLCGINGTSNGNESSMNQSGFDGRAGGNNSFSSTPAEQILYNIRRQNCELAIALRKSISIVREKLDVEENARLEAQQRAKDFLDAANVVDQALQKAAAVVLKEERNLANSKSSVATFFDAVSVPHHHQHHRQQQQQYQQQRPSILFAPINSDVDEGSHERRAKNVSPPQLSPVRTQDGSYLFGNNNDNRKNLTIQHNNRNDLNRSPSRTDSSTRSFTIGTSLAVLKDITFGSLDVIRDMQKIMSESISSLQQHQDGVAAAAAQTQLAVDRARSAERAVAGQALLELRREIDAHQHTRTTLQRKIAFVTEQYEKLLHSVTSGEDGEYWELSTQKQQQSRQGHHYCYSGNGISESREPSMVDRQHNQQHEEETASKISTAATRSSNSMTGVAATTQQLMLISNVLAADDDRKFSGNEQQQQQQMRTTAAAPSTAIHRTNSPSPYPVNEEGRAK